MNDRVKGVLIGCAYGDAMGMPTENLARKQILERYPKGIDTFVESVDQSENGRTFLPGQVTDDTINTILLLRSIAENNGKPDGISFIRSLQKWIDAHPEENEVIIGRSTRRAINAIENGQDISTTGYFGSTNGASMKISPIGIISDYRDPDTLIDNVYEICYPTHNNRIAIQGASVVASLISCAVRNGTIDDVESFSNDVIDHVKDRGFVTGTPDLKNRIHAVCEDAKYLSQQEMIGKLSDFYGTGIETYETIPAVIAILEMSDYDPVKCGKIAAVIGNDTDTIGAIACAIAGAFHPESFSDEDIDLLQNVNHIDFDELAELIRPFMA